METPVLLLAYNRPEQTSRVLQSLRKNGAKRVYVSIDGPKNASDRTQINAVKSAVDSCRDIVVETSQSDKNLGCKQGVITGIDWFFNRVEEGIILEDDCLPSEHFFPFVNDMLNRYRDTKEVYMISGCNPAGKWDCDAGHFFTRVGQVWGWATWKNRWQSFNPDLPHFNSFVNSFGFEKNFGPTKMAASRKRLTELSLKGEIDTWDYQWNVHILMDNGVAAIPERNLVQNIGFEASGTNIQSKPNWIVTETSAKAIEVDDRSIEIDREFEMELELAKRSNLPAQESLNYYRRKGNSSTRNLKILLINSTDIGGGAEKIAYTIHEQLLSFGHDSRLLVEVKKSDSDCVTEITNWQQQVSEFDPDVIHIHNLHGTSIDLKAFAEISARIPVLFTAHDSWLATGSITHPFVYQPDSLSLLELLEWKKESEKRKSLISNSKIRFSAPSQWMRELLYNALEKRAFHVPNGTDSAPPVEVNPPSDNFILFVANQPVTNPYKDFDTLKKAWKKANQELKDEGLDLVVLGGKSSTEKVENQTIFLEEFKSSSEVLGYMAKAKFVVHSSLQDNAPLAILEAHAVGTKVVASMVGGIPELLDSEECEWLYEPKNVDDLATKLLEASRVTSDCKRTNQSTFDSIVQAYLGHYYQLVNA